MKRYEKMLESIGLPGRDAYELPTSDKRFADGAQYRIEVPGIQNPEAAKALVKATAQYGITLNRITETRGIMRLTDAEILEMIGAAKSISAELVLSVGPRAMYDTSAQYQTGTSEAGRVAYRLRGADQLARAVADVHRATELGCRYILIYDEGLLWALNQLRQKNMIPSDVKFKVSAHCGHGNPASIKLLEELGANSINAVRDLQLPMMAALRKAASIPLDLHVDNPKSTGGFIRTYEAPEIVRIAAPVYLKCGASVFATHAWPTTEKEAQQCAKQAYLAQKMIERFYPEAVQSKPAL
jgi:hypothetical protein